MDLWQTILKTALLGTARDAPLPTANGDAIGQTLAAACAGADADTALLRAAAVVGTTRLAGFVPTRGTMAGEAAAAETLRACSTAVASYLARMLLGEYPEVLPEWLAALAAANQRVPHRDLPDLLERAREKPELRPALRPVLGQRGAWLIGQNPLWQFESLEDDAAAWETGTREIRIAAFRRLRQANPVGARQRLEASWPQETPEDRAQLVECLAAGLDMADEPFLEAALDDRRKEVRKAAAELLMRLPGSRLTARMIQRLRDLVKVTVAEKRKLLGLGAARSSRTITVASPEACDKAMVRDGIEPKPPAGTGEKAWWLEQIVAAAPPDAWQEGDVPPAALIEAAGQSDWAVSVYRGWSRMAARHREMRWAAALLPWQLGQNEKQQDVQLIEQLAVVLPPAERESAALGVLETYRLSLVAPAARALLMACRPWSASLTRGVIEAIGKGARNDPAWVYRFRELASEYALRMEPSLADQLASMVAAADASAWAKAMEPMVGLVQFRRQMLETIKSVGLKEQKR